jgi:hypothetical protein
LGDPIQLECPTVLPQMTMSDECQFALEPADFQGLNDAVRAAIAGVDVFHHDSRLLLERFLQFQRQRIFARVGRAQVHWPALLSDGIEQ